MDQIIDNEVILIGSSMGGWISTLVSLKRRKKVKGLILIAPALDMTENLMWKKFSLKEKKLIKSQGYIERYVEDYDSSYRITKKLIDDGKKHLILKDKINLNRWMVRNGHAVAYRRYSKEYIIDEEFAKENKLGLWRGKFLYPEKWRKLN